MLVTLGRDQMEARWSATLPAGGGRDGGAQGAGGQALVRGLDRRVRPRLAVRGQRPGAGEPSPRGSAGAGVPALAGRVAQPDLPPAEGRRGADDDHRPRVAPPFAGRRASKTPPSTCRCGRAAGGRSSSALPEGAEVQELKVKGVDRPIRPDGSKLTLTIEPGEQPVKVAWRTNGGLGLGYRGARRRRRRAGRERAGLRAPARGPLAPLRARARWGPAVLFWGTCVLFVAIVSVVLSRTPLTPLTTAGVGPPGPRPDPDPPRGRRDRGGMVPRAGLAARPRPRARPVLHDLLQIALVIWTLLAIVFLYARRAQGLALRPDMQVAGGGSTDTLLQWYQDRIDGAPAAALGAERAALGLSPDHAARGRCGWPCGSSAGCPGAGRASRAAASGVPCALRRSRLRPRPRRPSLRPFRVRPGRMTRSTARA